MAEQIFKRRCSWEGVVMPDIVYKYRNATNPQHLEILKEGRLVFAAPDSFPDKKDCNMDYDPITEEDAFNYYYEATKKKYPGRGKQYIVAKAKAEINIGVWCDTVVQEEAQQEFRERFNSQFGVLSLTENCKRLEMWEGYSHNLNGFCIGIDPRITHKSIGGGAGKVIYYDEDKKPELKHLSDADLQYQTLIFYKLRQYDWEEEHRMHKTWFTPATLDDRKMKIPNAAFKQLIIGENVAPDVRDTLTNDARALNPKIEIHTARLVDGSIVIEP